MGNKNNVWKSGKRVLLLGVLKNKSKMTDFEKMSIMSKRNMDIRMCGRNQMVEAKTVKAGGHVTMGVDSKTILDILNGDLYMGFYCMNKEEFDKVSNEDDPHFVNSLPQAIHVLTYQLRCDDAYRESWKSNIAMAFYDAYSQQMKELNEPVPELLHKIANDAADYFLGNLTRTEASA